MPGPSKRLLFAVVDRSRSILKDLTISRSEKDREVLKVSRNVAGWGKRREGKKGLVK